MEEKKDTEEKQKEQNDIYSDKNALLFKSQQKKGTSALGMM